MPQYAATVSGFDNENTILKLKQAGKPAEFDRKYEEAVARVRKELGHAYTNIIAGKRLPSTDGSFRDENPANTDEVLGHFPSSTKEDTLAAIAAAKDAFPQWSALDWRERVRLVRRAADLLRKRKYEFAAWMTLENGKNRTESMNDVDEAIDMLTYYPWWYEKNDGFAVQMGQPLPGERCVSVLKPYGTWAVIAPFNFPVAIAIGMTTGALLTGNTAVLKPASDTPLVGYKFIELLEEAGVAAGVVNFVTGSGSIVGQTLIDSPDVAGVVFTGSRDVGKKVMLAGAKHGRPSIVEMGGKNPIIVAAKADLEKAVEGCARSAFGYSGQKCSAASRVYVHRSLYEEFKKKMVDWTKKNVKVGLPENKDTFLGPVVTGKSHDNFLTFVEKAKKGGKIVHGGASAAKGPLAKGHYVEPTIVEGLSDEHWVTCNELFVPIVSLYSFDSLDEAVRRANAVEFGLTAGIFSEDPKDVQYFFDHIEVGVAYANRKAGGSTGAMVGGQSFGGWKHSASTSRGAGGPWYLQQFLREQSQTRAS